MNKHIGLIGPGKLGLCMALLLEEAGFAVTAIENNPTYLQKLQNRSLDSHEPGITKRLSKSNILFTSDFGTLYTQQIETFLIYVPTPDSEKGYDHGPLERVFAELISKGSQQTPTTVMVGCTTLPGFCQSFVEELKALNYQLVYCPSFIAQGTIIKNLQQPDILLFGSDHRESAIMCQMIMQTIAQNTPSVHHMDLLSAEITKLGTNCFLTAKIAFANAIGDLAIKTGGDQKAILNAIGHDSRIGNAYLNYGFGFGGPCFPRDNRALNYFARKNEYDLLLSEATEKANEQHTHFQILQLEKEHDADEIIHFDHVTYKPDSDILVESQQLKIALELAKSGRKVSVSGDHHTIEELRTTYGSLFIYP
jgi:UDPglucose 6-dehydrogenase